MPLAFYDLDLLESVYQVFWTTLLYENKSRFSHKYSWAVCFQGKATGVEGIVSVGVNHNHQAEVVFASVSCFGITLS